MSELRILDCLTPPPQVVARLSSYDVRIDVAQHDAEITIRLSPDEMRSLHRQLSEYLMDRLAAEAAEEAAHGLDEYDTLPPWYDQPQEMAR